MALVIPLQPVPLQTVSVQLEGQSARIRVAQKSIGMFLDLYVLDALIVGGVACRNDDRIVRNAYLGFVGDLAFVDTQGEDDPEASGLGSRWILVYFPQ